MPNRLHYAFALLLAFGPLAFPSSAYAGFQWVAPTDNAVVVPSPSVQTWPVAPSVSVTHAPSVATAAPEVISPVIITGNSGVPASTVTGVATMLPSSAVSSDVVTLRSSNIAAPASVPTVGGDQPPAHAIATAPILEATTLSTSPVTDVVHGFAKQVPIAVALRQILPAGYGFSVDPDVDLGTLVSFQGGKPWRDTLQDALRPSGLAMHEQGQMVVIGRANTAVVETPAIVPAMPAPHIVDVAPPVAPIAVADSKVPIVEEWHAERGDNLHKVIEAWTKRAGIELNWLAEYDYPLQATYNYTGTFEDAVRNLLTGFEEAHPQPYAELHNNPALNLRVLLVQTRGNSYSD